MAEKLDNGLPAIKRVMTQVATGGDVFTNETSTKIPEALEWQQLSDGPRFCLTYATNTIPVNLNEEADLSVYRDFLSNKPGITVPGGTVCRIVDMNPGCLSPMHRTVSLDYGVVLEGEVALVLDSGEERLLRRGDVAIQRGTNHAWRNNSKTEWARMLYVLQEALPLTLDGKALEEDYGGIPGVRPSKEH